MMKKTNVFAVCSLIIHSLKDLQSLLRAYLHGIMRHPMILVHVLFLKNIRHSILRET